MMVIKKGKKGTEVPGEHQSTHSDHLLSEIQAQFHTEMSPALLCIRTTSAAPIRSPLCKQVCVDPWNTKWVQDPQKMVYCITEIALLLYFSMRETKSFFYMSIVQSTLFPSGHMTWEKPRRQMFNLHTLCTVITLIKTTQGECLKTDNGDCLQLKSLHFCLLLNWED